MAIKVCCAIIIENKKVLAAQRGHKQTRQMKWEFPGGKIEAGETCDECIVREIKEELSLNILAVETLASVTHAYTDIKIELIPIICKIVGGNLHIKDHQSLTWVSYSEMKKLNWSDADSKVINNLREFFKSL